MRPRSAGTPNPVARSAAAEGPAQEQHRDAHADEDQQQRERQVATAKEEIGRPELADASQLFAHPLPQRGDWNHRAGRSISCRHARKVSRCMSHVRSSESRRAMPFTVESVSSSATSSRGPLSAYCAAVNVASAC